MKDLRREATALKEVVADLTLESRLLKKSMSGDSRMEQTELIDPAPILQSIKAPTLLLWGEKDAMIPLSNAEDYLKTLPNSKLVTLPGIGHLPQEEAAESSLVPLKAFLAANPS